MSVQIAIDGPSGAGKSSMAKMLARKKHFTYLDTGAMYRAFGVHVIKKGINVDSWKEDSPELTEALKDFVLDIKYIDDEQHVIVNGEDVTGIIRTPEVSLVASKVSAVPDVRLRLVEIQREIAESRDVVMDGRDIGSYVLPNATVKIFLTASAEVRAERRLLELREKGDEKSTYEEVLEDMKLRDRQDSTRSFAPLVCVSDAVKIDSSEISFDETLALIKKTVDERI